MLSARCYPLNWEFRKCNFYGPKKTTTGQRDLVSRPVSRPAPSVAVTESATEAGQAVAAEAVVSPTEVASVPSGSGEEMEIPCW